MFISSKELRMLFGWIFETSIICHMTEFNYFLNSKNFEVKLIIIRRLGQSLVQIIYKIIEIWPVFKEVGRFNIFCSFSLGTYLNLPKSFTTYPFFLRLKFLSSKQTLVIRYEFGFAAGRSTTGRRASSVL